MNLIKCSHCGRPFYDSESHCPYCGSDARLSANNRITQPITDAKMHKIMEDVLSGNYRPEPVDEHAAPVVADIPATPEPETIAAIEPDTIEPDVIPSEAVQERAEAIANATEGDTKEFIESDTPDDEELETSHLPRKRHTWLWILLIVLLLAAAAVYWQWDFVYSKISQLIK